MSAPVTLAAFEKVDGLHSQLVRMGDFETCADPRGYIQISNRLLDACVDAGMDYETQGGFASHEDWAADFVARAMLSADMVEDVA